MRIRVRNPQDLAAGLLFLAIASGALWVARDYPIGTAVRMSSGYFPRLLCLLLVAIGALRDAARARASTAPRSPPCSCGRCVLVTASVVVFACAIQTLGRRGWRRCCSPLIGGYASPRVRLVEMVAAAAVLALLTVAIFIWGIGLPIPVWPEL